jgi:hypothetical protein
MRNKQRIPSLAWTRCLFVRHRQILNCAAECAVRAFNRYGLTVDPHLRHWGAPPWMALQCFDALSLGQRADRLARHLPPNAPSINRCSSTSRRSRFNEGSWYVAKLIARHAFVLMGVSILDLSGCATTGKTDLTGSGINVGNPETYDNTFFQTQLATLRAQLMGLQTVDQGSLISAIGGVQGAQLEQSSFNLQVQGQATPQVATTLPASSKVAPTASDTRVTTQSSMTPTIPATTQSTLTLPSSLSGSPLDVLNQQMQLSSQVLNYEMLLSGSNYARFGISGNAKIQLTLGFPITIEPPTPSHKDDIADVEVTYCFATDGGTPPSVINLLPTDNSYNVISLTDDAHSFGLGVIAGVFSVGGSYSSGTKTEYLIKQQDTVALRRDNKFDTESNAGSACKGGQDGKPDTKAYESTTFAWQFRPVLGEHFVRSGIHQTFVQIAIPNGLATNGKAKPEPNADAAAIAKAAADAKAAAVKAAGGSDKTASLSSAGDFAAQVSGRIFNFFFSATQSSAECPHGNDDIPSDLTSPPKEDLTRADVEREEVSDSGFVVVRARWVHLDPKTGVASNRANESSKTTASIRMPVRGRPGDYPVLSQCIKTRDMGGGNLWVRLGGLNISGTQVRVGTSLLNSSTPGFSSFDDSLEFVVPAMSIANGGAYLVAPSGREIAIYPNSNPNIGAVPDEHFKVTQLSVSPIDNSSSLVAISIERTGTAALSTSRPLIVTTAGKMYGLSDSPFVGEEVTSNANGTKTLAVRLIASNTALIANPTVSVQRLLSGQPAVEAAVLPPGSISISALPVKSNGKQPSVAAKTCEAPGQCLVSGYLPGGVKLTGDAPGACRPTAMTIGTSRVMDVSTCTSKSLKQVTFSTTDTVTNFEQDLTVSLAGDQPSMATAGSLAATVPAGSVAPHFSLNRTVGNITTKEGSAILTVSILNLKDPTATVTVAAADVSDVVDGTGKSLALTAIGQVTVVQDSTLVFHLANCCSSKVTVTAEGKNGTISTGKLTLDFLPVNEKSDKSVQARK